MKVLILGGHGFVGTSVRRLIETAGDRAIPISRRDGVDFTDYAATRRAIADVAPDAIINCAAHVGSLHYVTTYAADVVHDNVAMALNLYRAVAEAAPSARVVNPSPTAPIPAMPTSSGSRSGSTAPCTARSTPTATPSG